jgi:chromosome segregation ATPase
MSAIGAIGGGAASSDKLFDLLAVIKDPATFEERLTQFSAAEKSANDAEARLALLTNEFSANQSALAEARAQLDKDVAEFAAHKDEILQKSAKLDATSAAMAQERIDLDAARNAYMMRAKSETDAMAGRETAVATSEVDLSHKHAEVDALKASLEVAKAELDHKFDAFAALAQRK